MKSPQLSDAVKRVAVTGMMVHKRKSYASLKQEVENKRNKGNVVAITTDYLINVSSTKILCARTFLSTSIDWLCFLYSRDQTNQQYLP